VEVKNHFQRKAQGVTFGGLQFGLSVTFPRVEPELSSTIGDQEMGLTHTNGTVDHDHKESFAKRLEELMNAFDAVEYELRKLEDGATKEGLRSCASRLVGLMNGRLRDC
jgi:hypothetical protein